jgi:hypothetical protein
MIKLSYKLMNNEGFNEALATLSSSKGFADVRTAYNVGKIAKKYSEALQVARRVYTEKSEKFLVKDDTGAFVQAETPNGLCPFQIKEGMKEEFEAMMADFMQTEIAIEVFPLELESLGDVKLSPLQVLALEPLLVVEPVSGEQLQLL